jgi:hypothetical protein
MNQGPRDNDLIMSIDVQCGEEQANRERAPVEIASNLIRYQSKFISKCVSVVYENTNRLRSRDRQNQNEGLLGNFYDIQQHESEFT